MIKRFAYFAVILIALTGCKKDFSHWKEANESWLTQNEAQLGQNSEVKESGITPTGLQYEIYHRGFGQVPKTSSYVNVTYAGWLIDGTQFDTGTTTWFTVSSVISGWQEMLRKMPQGSRFRIYVPQALAYGEEGSEGSSAYSIPPYSTLIFDIEIVDVLQVAPE